MPQEICAFPFFVHALLASPSSSICCQIISIAFLVQTGISSFPNRHTSVVPRNAFHWTSLIHLCTSCEWEVIVQGDEGPVGGVAQVLCHGVIVVVGHQEEGQEEEGEKQGEVEGEEEQLKDNRTCAWMG